MRTEDDEVEGTRDLLAPLAGEPQGPSAVDVSRAMADARRRMRHRRFAGVGAAAAVTALAVAGAPLAWDTIGGAETPSPPAAATATAAQPSEPAAPAMPARCEFSLLATPEGSYQSLITGSDPTGRFLLGRSYTAVHDQDSSIVSGTRVQVLIWEDGVPTEVDLPGADPTLRGANSHGVAVGHSFQDDDNRSAWIYDGEKVSALAGDNVRAVAVNDQAVIAGTKGHLEEVPVVWRSPDEAPQELSVPGSTWTVSAVGIDADGTVVGSGYDRQEIPDPSVQSFVWSPDGTARQLPLPTVDGAPAHSFAATAIHEGVVLGRAGVPFEEQGASGTHFHHFSYDLASGEFTQLAGSGMEPAHPHGWTVGGTDDGGLALRSAAGTVELPVPDLDQELDTEFGPYDLALITAEGLVVAGQVRVFDEDAPQSDGDQRMSMARAVAWHCD